MNENRIDIVRSGRWIFATYIGAGHVHNDGTRYMLTLNMRNAGTLNVVQDSGPDTHDIPGTALLMGIHS